MPKIDSALRPICFMVMPFGTKPVEGTRSGSAPAEVDFNALWDKAFSPGIDKAGYMPIRADQDPGSVIVKDMLERLAFADLVLADLSLPNGNVYYEVGLRHVVREKNCVLLAAEWSRQLFDVDQFRTVRYPLTDGGVTDAAASEIMNVMIKAIERLSESKTPYHELISEGAGEEIRRGAFRDQTARLADFQARARAIRLLEEKEKKKAEIYTLHHSIEDSALRIPDVAVEMLQLIRDGLGWGEMKAFVESLPTPIQEMETVREQYLLAVGETGEPELAIRQLEQLIGQHGNTPERQGLIGGRYKRLWSAERKARVARNETQPSVKERRYLEKSIRHYTEGMWLDLNSYYCASNLPTLLQARNADGDAKRAVEIDYLVIAACERAISLDIADEWVRPTLLGAAFRAGDVDRAKELANQVEIEGSGKWQLNATLSDLSIIVKQINQDHVQADLEVIYERLQVLTEN